MKWLNNFSDSGQVPSHSVFCFAGQLTNKHQKQQLHSSYYFFTFVFMKWLINVYKYKNTRKVENLCLLHSITILPCNLDTLCVTQHKSTGAKKTDTQNCFRLHFLPITCLMLSLYDCMTLHSATCICGQDSCITYYYYDIRNEVNMCLSGYICATEQSVFLIYAFQLWHEQGQFMTYTIHRTIYVTWSNEKYNELKNVTCISQWLLSGMQWQENRNVYFKTFSLVLTGLNWRDIYFFACETVTEKF